MSSFELILITIVSASTPFLLAALGELVTERAGVLNLGVEGMMAVSAACGFAAAVTFDSNAVGLGVGILAGMATSLLFAIAVLGFAVNQVGCGLALTIFGLGVSGMVGSSFVGIKREQIGAITIPLLSEIPFIGKALFAQNILVYVSLIMPIILGWYLARTRSGLLLRSVGENHSSAQSLGLPVLRVRFCAVLFGGACAGLAGVYLSLVLTGFWSTNMTAGKGWIAVLLVVFAAWKNRWLVLGAYIFGASSVLQLHAQLASTIGIPPQLMTSVPYVVTIFALVLLARRHGRNGGAPGSLGIPYITDR